MTVKLAVCGRDECVSRSTCLEPANIMTWYGLPVKVG